MLPMENGFVVVARCRVVRCLQLHYIVPFRAPRLVGAGMHTEAADSIKPKLEEAVTACVKA